jgi:hypothetical protein
MFLLWCCAWKSTVLGTYSHKKVMVHAAHFFNCSLSDLIDVSFVHEYQYFICRAWSALSKTVLTLM